MRLPLVALDGPSIADLRGVRVLPELALRLPLAKEVPALVQLDLQLAQASLLVRGRDAVRRQPVSQHVLLVDEVGDALPNAAVGHARQATPGRQETERLAL
jgi:hypothetical protein